MIKAFTKFSITTDIRKLLVANTGLTSMVGSNIYPLIAPEAVTGDTVLYYRDSYNKEQVQMGVYNDNCRVFICVVSDNYDRSIQIAENINDIIEGEHLNKDGYKYTCNLVDSTEDYEDKKYLQILLFQIK